MSKRVCHKYTEVEDNWIRENLPDYSWKDLRNEFNSRFSTSVSTQSLVSHAIMVLGLHRTHPHEFTKEQDTWIRDNISQMSYSEMTKSFNEIFHANITVNTLMYRALYVLNISRDVGHFFTPEEDEWLRANVDSGTYQGITERFNATFRTNQSYQSVSDRMIRRLHLKKSINTGDISKGERRCTNMLPIGSESFNGQAVYVKIADNVNVCQNRRMPSKHQDPNWKRKDYIVWKQHGNEPPVDSTEMLIHLDGDRQNCNIENLYKTSRKINLMLAKNKWFSEDPDITLAAIKWCELYYAIKEQRNE